MTNNKEKGMSDNRYKHLASNQQIIKKLLDSQPHLKISAKTVSHPVKGAGRIPLIEVDDYLALVRICGYFKYNIGEGILYRGQVNLYPNLQPSIFRSNKQTPKQLENMIKELRNFGVIDSNKISAKSIPQKDLSTEPTLQHYGIETRWVDLVDSIPHAIFFATNKCTKSSITTGKSTFVPSISEYGHLYLISTGNRRKPVKPGINGIWKTETGLTICDLRTAKPSRVLRPHAQHGLLIRGAKTETDYFSRVISIIRFKTKLAANWIDGAAFSRETMIPNPTEDPTYAQLTGDIMKRFIAAFPQYEKFLNVPTYDFD